MATVYKIHPAIGIARVGNSPDEFFIGPERSGEMPEPSGGFKDAQCRVKRQAARFRIFAHHDNGTTEEITAAEADITWNVHVANKKAAFPGRGNSESAAALTIDPGSRSLATPNGAADLDGGTITFTGQSAVEVPLGQIRTDDDGHLLVLGGHGTSASPAGNGIGNFWTSVGWYDDVSDGPVTATIMLHGSNATPAVTSAWVIIAPPKFAPHQDSVTTLYDRVLQQMVDNSLESAGTITSYTDDVYPILQRARDMAWVEGTMFNHVWIHPITAQAAIDSIFSRIENPTGGGGNMPQLNGSDSKVTPIQYAHLQRWKNGTFTNDWSGVPPISPNVDPNELDRVALDACVGGAFYPGIEAGGRFLSERPILEKPYTAPFRIDHTQSGPGDISASMALPWQADFKACGDNWWPVPRPNDVLVTSGGATIKWDRDVANMDEMVTEWSSLGFVVKQGSEHLEVQHCDEQSILLLTPHLNFLDVGQGPMAGVREVPLAITFEVISPGAAVTLEYAPGGAPNHPQLVPIDTSVVVGATAANAVATAHLWLVFRTGTANSAMPTQTLTLREPVSGRTWQVTVDGNTVPRTTTGVALALDRSGSMQDDRGDGQSKHDSLQQAANLFVDLMLQDDGVGIVRFNENAQVLQNVLQLGNGQLSDTNRNNTHDTINGNGLDPQGGTSIGDGIFESRGILDAVSAYDSDALVVLSDGVENQSRWIADVAPEIDAATYAVGLGKPENISVQALQTIAGNSGGYLLVTGAITQDNRFRLQKHFLQILSGINNAEVVLDPDGSLTRDRIVRIPFSVSDADTGIEVVLLTPLPTRVDFRLQSPLGQLIEPWQALSDPAMTFGFSDGSAYYRLALPLQIEPGRFDQAGTWHVLLRIGEPRLKADKDGPDTSILLGTQPTTHELAKSESLRRFDLTRAHALEVGPSAASHFVGDERDTPRRNPSLPFSVVVHAYSNVTFAASADQQTFSPGATVDFRASLTQSGRPIDQATVWATVSAPSGSTFDVQLDPDRDEWTGSFIATTPGVYEARVRAKGRTRAGVPFTRERLVTAMTWRGGDRPGDPAGDPHPPSDTGTNGDQPDWCEFIQCLIGPDGAIGDRLRKQLIERGLDVERIWKCLETCRRDSTG